ncbi:UNVERIFIED_CONTAM: hypothetical protein GTU68_052641 [Idotea baltica]|nr:hypothetical protein [Idotea baltica]
MLNSVIRFALRNRLLIVALAMAVMVYGTVVSSRLPIDVLPDLTRPRVVLLTECHGMAPEEIESLVSFPLEAAVNGAPGVQAVRSSSNVGYSLINVEFDWDADIYNARQIVQERISTVIDSLPEGIRPQMGPISSLLGQIMLIGIWSEDGTHDPLTLRTTADWVIRKRLLTIPGVSQITTMGGGRMQYQVLVDPHLLHKFDVSLQDLEDALKAGNLNITGGYLDSQPRELLVRGLGRVTSIDDIADIVVNANKKRPVLVRHIARVVQGQQIKRGDSSVNGNPAVVMTIQKQPKADTRALTAEILKALPELRRSLPDGVVLQPTYQQREFIDYSVNNVIDAVRDGAILVVIVLFLFLLNFRTTFITLTAIPLSILTTALIFRWFDLSINVMTLGGIAVALGELVDDAIVDVENIFRRLSENSRLDQPRSVLKVVYEASREVRSSIIMSTVLVVMVFAPLFALAGMPGRMFAPLGIAYIVSILASTLVSLTVTPVLSYFLLSGTGKKTTKTGDGFVLRACKAIASPFIRFSMTAGGLTSILIPALMLVIACVMVVMKVGRDYIPDFDEGAMQVNLFLEPGASLKSSREVSAMADERFMKLIQTDENPTAPIRYFTARTGRAEEDEHAMDVNTTEYVIALNPARTCSRAELTEMLEKQLELVKGAQNEVEQPIAHMISHMVSGVTAQIAVKIYGDDLNELRKAADKVEKAIKDIEGIKPPVIEQQRSIPQLRVTLKRDQLAYYGLSAAGVNEMIATALQGHTVSQVLDGQRVFDLVLRFDDEFRNDYLNLDRLPIELPGGGRVPLKEVATINPNAVGPNKIDREGARRRIVVRVNTKAGHDVGSAADAIQKRIDERVELPEGYFFELAGQFEAQQSASRTILLLSIVSMMGVFIVLYATFPSTTVVLQILIAIPAAFIGGVIALVISRQSLSVPSMVGFISLGGIAARNGLLLVSSYVQRYRTQGFTREMILAGSLDRLAPVMMTALTTGIGLLPLITGGNLPGREFLLPVATVILGGLVSSTIAEFLIRPGLFWALSEPATRKLAKVNSDESEQAGDGLD